MFKNGLYHKDVFWCDKFDKMISEYIGNGCTHKIILSQHCKKQEYKTWRRMYVLEAITYSNLVNAEPFEILIENNQISKVVVRYNFNSEYDISVVYLVTFNHDIFVKTAWLNSVSDSHQTLNINKYIS